MARAVNRASRILESKRVLYHRSGLVLLVRDLSEPANSIIPTTESEVRLVAQDEIVAKVEAGTGSKNWLERTRAGHLCFAAYVGGAIVGYAWVGFDAAFDGTSGWRDIVIARLKEKEAYLYDGFVLPEHRSKKIAQRIYQYAIVHLRREGFERLYAAVSRDNVASVKALLGCGFRPIRGFGYVNLLGLRRVFYSPPPKLKMSVASVDQMVVRQIATDEFAHIEQPWNEMVERDPLSTVFSTWEWLATYWKYFGEQSQLAVAVLEDSGRFVAAAPLCLTQRDGIRRLNFVGTPYLDYSDFISTVGDAGTKRLLENLAGRRDWDCVELDQIPQGSLTPSLCSNMFASTGMSVKTWDCEVCPYITLPPHWSDYGKLHPTAARKSLYYSRKLRRKYPLELRNYRKVTAHDPLMDVLFRLHQERWGKVGEEGLFRNRRMQDFHRELASRLGMKNQLLLSILEADGAPISAVYGFIHRQWFGAYISGMDPEFANEISFSPGILHLGLLIREFIESKLIKEFDLMRGNEPYKYIFAHEKKINRATSIHRNSA